MMMGLKDGESGGWGDGGRWQMMFSPHFLLGFGGWFLVGLERFLVELNLSERWQKECFFLLLPRLWKRDWFDSLLIDLTVSAWWSYPLLGSEIRNPHQFFGITWSDPIYEGNPRLKPIQKVVTQKVIFPFQDDIIFHSPGFRYLHFLGCWASLGFQKKTGGRWKNP